jgi:hypothetical protein
MFKRDPLPLSYPEIVAPFFFFLFFFYWAPMASVPGSTEACRLIVRARFWKFPLVPPGTPTPTTTRETSSREKGTMGKKCLVNFAVK